MAGAAAFLLDIVTTGKFVATTRARQPQDQARSRQHRPEQAPLHGRYPNAAGSESLAVDLVASPPLQLLELALGLHLLVVDDGSDAILDRAYGLFDPALRTFRGLG